MKDGEREQMPTKNSKTETRPTPSSMILQNPDWSPSDLESWNNSNPVVQTLNKGKANESKRMVVPPLQLSATVPPELMIPVVQYAASQGVADGTSGQITNDQGLPDVRSGYLSRAVRRSLFGVYLPHLDAEAWENERADRLSAERSDRMKALAESRGESIADVKAKLSVLDKLRSSKTLMAALQAEDSELYALLADMDSDS